MLMRLPKSRPKPAKKMSRRRLLRSAGAAALTLTLPRFVDAQTLEPRHQEHSRLLLAHIGMSRQSGDNWLRSWLGGLMHEPEARLRGIVLHGAPGSGKSSFTRAVGGLLVKDGFVVTHERALLEYGYLDAWRIAAKGKVGTVAGMEPLATSSRDDDANIIIANILEGILTRSSRPAKSTWQGRPPGETWRRRHYEPSHMRPILNPHTRRPWQRKLQCPKLLPHQPVAMRGALWECLWQRSA